MFPECKTGSQDSIVVKIRDRQLADLLEEIAAAMRVDAPLAATFKSLSERRLGRVAKLASQLEGDLGRGRSLSEALLSNQSDVLKRAGAAVKVAEQTGNEKVLDDLALAFRSRANQKRAADLAWFYPVLLLLMVYGTITFVATPTVLGHHGRGVSWPEPVVQVCQFLNRHPWAPLAVFGAAAVAAIALKRTSRMSQQTRIGLFCQTLADQIDGDVPEQQAIETAVKVSGDHPYSEATSVSDLKPLLNEVQLPISDVPGATVKQQHVANLKFLANVFYDKARRSEFFLSRVVPRLATVLIGCGGIGLYVVCIILPVYQQVALW